MDAPSRAGLTVPAPLWAELAAAYRAPGRAYHNLTHIGEMLARYDEVARDVGWRAPREVFVAVLFHDAVYDALLHDNEAKSAAWLARALPGLGDVTLAAARIDELILLTARHSTLRPGDVDDEAALFLDCDMAIVGAARARYDEYERAVAVEYAAVPRELYVAGRRRFLEKLRTAERIFLSAYFHDQLDAAARANVERALAALTT